MGKEIILRVADLASPQIARFRAQVERYADASMAANTRRAYASDWADFSAWCAASAASALPADPRVVAAYLIARANTVSVATLKRRLAAIRTAHRERDLEPPGGGDLIRTWAGIRREHGRPAHKKAALTVAELKRMVGLVPADTPRGLRNRALLLVGFATAMRRSELAAMCVDRDGETAPVRCEFVAGGLQIRIDRSKADQDGEGALIGAPRGTTKFCPVAALEAWLMAAGIEAGPVFRAVDRHGKISEGPIAAKTVAEVVKEAALRAGLDPARLGAHSLRAGFITAAIAAGVDPELVMRQSRHARFDTMRGYVREAEVFSRNAASRIGL